jgi:hypothetical protein
MALLVGGGVGLAVGSATRSEVEETPEASHAEQPHSRVQAPQAPGNPSPRARSRPGNLPPEEWWARARAVLLADLVLSEDQAGQMDAIIERQVAVRGRARELQSELRVARRQGDTQRGGALQAEIRSNRARIKNPHARIDEMRSLLTEEQRPIFDMNRARLVAEGQEARRARLGKKRKRPAGASAEKVSE